MKVAILAGGFGSRMAEETEVRPKPMVEIGGYPILWHIMRHYAHYGFKDLVIALGYKGEYIKKYFVDYCSLGGDVVVDLNSRRVETNGDADLAWTVNLVETTSQRPHLSPDGRAASDQTGLSYLPVAARQYPECGGDERCRHHL
jgi:NDP-sugar pyrophosphorylase family protein